MATPADTIAEIIGKAVEDALLKFAPHLDTEIAHAIKDSVADRGKLTTILFGVEALAEVKSPENMAKAAALAAPLYTMESEAGGVGGAFGFGYFLGYSAYQAMLPVLNPLYHALNAALQTEIHDPDTSAQLVARGLFKPGHGADEAGGSGLDQDHFDRLVSLATTRLTVEQGLDLQNRGELPDGWLKGMFQHLGYDEQTQGYLLELGRNLLSPADLALGNLRGFIKDDELFAYGAALGVSETDMTTLVNNTGEPPGPQELLEAYRRQFINKDRLEHGIRQSRIRDEWIDVVEKLRLGPMSTADAVRAVVENYLKPEEGKIIAEQNGLIPEHWEPLLESAGRPIAHQEMGSLVHRGIATREQFNQAMRESDIKDKYIDFAFDTTQRLLPERLIVTAIRYGAVTLQDGAARLLQLGYDSPTVKILLKLGLRESVSTAHELTRAEITTLYSDGILNRANAASHLEALGYAADVANYILEIVDATQHAREIKAEVAVVRNNFILGAVDSVEAENSLRAIGLSTEQAAQNITAWNREKRRASRNLTEAQIVKAAKNDVFTWDEATTLLVALGYTAANAHALLLSNGAVPPTVPPPPRPTGPPTPQPPS